MYNYISVYEKIVYDVTLYLETKGTKTEEDNMTYEYS